MGKPGQIGLIEGWDEIPGARGCTPQSCAFRDHFADLRAAGATEVFGLSTQDTAYQAEAVARQRAGADPGLVFVSAFDDDYVIAGNGGCSRARSWRSSPTCKRSSSPSEAVVSRAASASPPSASPPSPARSS